MYKKLLALTALCIVSFPLNAMSRRGRHHTKTISKQGVKILQQLNQQDKFGNTPLHVVVMGPLQRKTYYPEFDALLPQELRKRCVYDQMQANNAAWLILQGARVNIKNNEGYTPRDFAESNMTMYPNLYAVVHAGVVLQDGTQKYSYPKLTPSGANKVLHERVDAIEIRQQEVDATFKLVNNFIETEQPHYREIANAMLESGLCKMPEEKKD